MLAFVFIFCCFAESQWFYSESADCPPSIWLPFTLLWVNCDETHVALDPIVPHCPDATALTTARKTRVKRHV